MSDEKITKYSVDTDAPECEEVPALTGVPEEVETPDSMEGYEPVSRAAAADLTWYWITMILILGVSAAVISFLIKGITPAVISVIATSAVLSCIFGVRKKPEKLLCSILLNIASGCFAILLTFPVILLFRLPFGAIFKSLQYPGAPKDAVVPMLSRLGAAALAVVIYDLLYIVLFIASKRVIPVLLSHMRKKRTGHAKKTKRVWARTGSAALSLLNCLLFFFFLLWVTSGFLTDLSKDAEAVAFSESENEALNKVTSKVREIYLKNSDVYEGVLFPNISAAGGRWLYERLTTFRYEGIKTTLHSEAYTLCLAFGEIAPSVNDNGVLTDAASVGHLRRATDDLMASDYCRKLTCDFLRSLCGAWMRGDMYFGIRKPFSPRYKRVIDLFTEFVAAADDKKIDSLIYAVLDGLDIVAYHDLDRILKTGTKVELLKAVSDRDVLSRAVSAIDGDTEEVLGGVVKAVCDAQALDISGTLLSAFVGNMGKIDESSAMTEGFYSAREIELLTAVIEDPFDDTVPPAEIFETLLDTTVSSELAARAVAELAALEDPLRTRVYTAVEQELIRTVFERIYDSTPTRFKESVLSSIRDLYKILKVTPNNSTITK
jgi:hypothetical protein